MTKRFVFRSNKYNVTHQDIQRGIEDRGYVDSNPITSNQTNPLDKWYTYQAQRDDQNVFPSSSANISRIQIHDAIKRQLDFLEFSQAQIFAEKEQTYHVGYNYNKQKLFNYVEEYLLQNPNRIFEFVKNPQQFLVSITGVDIKNILIHQGDIDETNTTLPFIKISGKQIIGHHKDGDFERGLQGPFTDHNVGGYKHRHQKIGTTTDRPERFTIADDGTTITIKSPVSGNLNNPYSRFSRNGFTKSVVNIKNIRILTGSNVVGNFVKNYEVISGLNRSSQNLALVDRPQNFNFTNIDSPYVSGVVDYALPDRRLLDGTYNKTVFVNKFGAPGDVNSTSPVYMDAESEEYSPYNTVNYRNSSPRYYLKAFLSTPSYFGGYESGSFGVSASYQKTQRNNRRIPISGTTSFRLREDNSYVSYGIPARNGGYLWINNYTTGGNNPGLYVNSPDPNVSFITSAIDGLYFSPLEGNYYTITENNLLTLDSSVNNVLRKYNIQYNGLWNFSVKKQLSQNYNKIIEQNRKTNHFTDYVYNPFSDEKEKAYIDFIDSPIKDKYTNTINVYVDEFGNEEEISYPFGQNYCSIISDTYSSEYSQIVNLYNDQRNIKTADKNKSLFVNLLKFDRYAKENNLKVKKIKKIKHEEKIFPKSQNVYRNFSRTRNAYSQSWADSLDNRLTEFTNSQGRVYVDTSFNRESIIDLKYSYWPLDANTYYDSVVPMSRDKSGELIQIDNPALYSSAIGSSFTIVVPSSSYFGARFGRNWNINRPANVVHEQAGRGPYFNTHETFYNDIRLMGQDCSIVPEFRISPRLDELYLSTGSIYDDVYNKLELTGTTLESTIFSVPTSSVFMEERAHSDFIDLNSFVNQNLTEYKLDSIKIKVKAIKKLLPYDEFYPQIRMLKLAQQFSSSYSSLFNLAGAQATFRTALASVYAPGIGFNSIKAGVGMPYAVVTGTASNIHQIITGSLSIYYYQKLPWETILYPYKNFQNVTNIYDVDPDIIINSTASISRTGSYNQIYDYKANNFYAEVINMFKENGELTSIKSKDNSEWYFPDLTKKYALDIVVNKRGNYYTYSSLENFGPKPYAFHNPPWGQISALSSTSSTYNNDRNAAPNEATASGESYVRVIFDPSSLFIGTQDYAVQGKYNIGDIIRNSSIEYYSSMLGGTTTTGTIQLSDIVDIFSVSADGKSWQPKLFWECPTADLNFYNLSAKLTNSSGNDSGAGTTNSAIRGIWHQYSSLSKTSEGLFLSVRDSSRNTILTGSLLDIVGFDNSVSKKIGKIASSKEMSEALVIIPFFLDNCQNEKYFNIDIELFEKLYQDNLGIVGELKQISRNYVLPPRMDYIRTRKLANRRLKKEEYELVKSPFLMFAFEFSSVLTKQDLADIWQGVMPAASTTAEVEYKEKEFFIGNYLKDLNFKLPDNTRFKIFKIKKRAAVNYNQIKDRTIGDNYLDYSYGYNWPYDYCSLLEMAEVKAELTYGYDIREDQNRVATDELNAKITQNETPETVVIASTSTTTQPTIINTISSVGDIIVGRQTSAELTPEEQLAARISGQ